MMLAQLATVKTRLAITGAGDDTVLTNLIELCGDRFEKELGRLLERKVSAQHECQGDAVEVRLPRYPVESIDSDIEVSHFPGEALTPRSGIAYSWQKESGVIQLPYALTGSTGRIRFVYTGGYVMPGTTPGSGQTALPDGIEHACVEQVAFWFQRRNRLGLQSMPGAGNTFFTLVKDLDLLPEVRGMLRGYRSFCS